MKKNLEQYKKYVFDGHLEILRKLFYNFINNEFEKVGGNDVNINSSQKDWLNVAIAQRGNELLILQTNIIAFVRYKNGRFTTFALPLSWLQKMGIHLSLLEKLLTTIKFSTVILTLSLRRIIGTLIKIFKATQNPKTLNTSNTVFYEGFPLHGQLNSSQCNEDYSLESSLRKLMLTDNTIIYQSNNKSLNTNGVKYLPSILPNLSYIELLSLLSIFLFYIIKSIIKLLFGVWKNLYILDQTLMAVAFRKASNKYQHKIYFFSYQGVQMRPVWTWIAEKNGAKIVQTNYSSNLMPSKSGKIEDRSYLKFSTWSIIIPFSPLLKPYTEQTTRVSCEVISKETLYFSDDVSLKIPNFSKHIVNIVDVAPLDPNLFIGHNDAQDFLETASDNPIEYFSRLLGDCIEICSQLGCQAVLKPKREDNRIHNEYSELIRFYSSSGQLHILPSEISPYRVVDETMVSIIQPFTSIGTISNNRDKLFYYDPLDKLYSNHEAAFGTLIIKSKDQLRNAIRSKITMNFSNTNKSIIIKR
ncbi:hypothetical protein N9M53_03875 [Alphaproteobacteria bacterium]|nr:hypothetical protein [Alphaproteobacteria bacterium]